MTFYATRKMSYGFKFEVILVDEPRGLTFQILICETPLAALQVCRVLNGERNA